MRLLLIIAASFILLTAPSCSDDGEDGKTQPADTGADVQEDLPADPGPPADVPQDQPGDAQQEVPGEDALDAPEVSEPRVYGTITRSDPVPSFAPGAEADDFTGTLLIGVAVGDCQAGDSVASIEIANADMSDPATSLPYEISTEIPAGHYNLCVLLDANDADPGDSGDLIPETMPEFDLPDEGGAQVDVEINRMIP